MINEDCSIQNVPYLAALRQIFPEISYLLVERAKNIEFWYCRIGSIDNLNYTSIKPRQNCSLNSLDFQPVAAVLLQHRGKPFATQVAAKCVNTTLQVVNVVDENKRQDITDSFKLRRSANILVQYQNPMNNIAWKELHFEDKSDVIWIPNPSWSLGEWGG